MQWRHNEPDGISNHQPRDCLPNRLLRRRSKEASKLRVTGLCVGNSPVTGEFPAKKPVTRKLCFYPFYDVIMGRNVLLPPNILKERQQSKAKWCVVLTKLRQTGWLHGCNYATPDVLSNASSDTHWEDWLLICISLESTRCTSTTQKPQPIYIGGHMTKYTGKLLNTMIFIKSKYNAFTSLS